MIQTQSMGPLPPMGPPGGASTQIMGPPQGVYNPGMRSHFSPQDQTRPKFFHFPRFQANESLQNIRFQNYFRRQSYRDNFRDLAVGGSRRIKSQSEGVTDDANIVALPGGFNAKQMRKPSMRKTVDYNSSVVKYLENRIWQRDVRDRRAFNPDKLHQFELVPPQAIKDNPMNVVVTRHIRTSVNKNKCPIFSLVWTPEGRRLVTGAHSGEFVLWNGLTFNFETILQAHDTAVRAMKWSHNDQWMITADHNGYIKYWQSNMNNVKMYQAHKEVVRGLSFCPSDKKFASCSDDGTVRIWDFAHCVEERILRGHGSDVKCLDWHPQKSMILSGSKDSQQPIKLWDSRTGVGLTTLHAHKNTCMDVKWNRNGNLFLTASRDHLIKLFDVRNMREDVLTYKGNKKEVTCVQWNPIHESLFASAGSDGAIMFWTTGGEKEVGAVDKAHDGLIWDLAWHPLGHILASGSNDHCVKFWGRNRLGDAMRDRYNLNILPSGMTEEDYDEMSGEGVSLIPGMGQLNEAPAPEPETKEEKDDAFIPGLEWTDEDKKALAARDLKEKVQVMKRRAQHQVHRRVPESFEKAWESGEQTIVRPKGEEDEREKEVKPKVQSLLSMRLEPVLDERTDFDSGDRSRRRERESDRDRDRDWDDMERDHDFRDDRQQPRLPMGGDMMPNMHGHPDMHGPMGQLDPMGQFGPMGQMGSMGPDAMMGMAPMGGPGGNMDMLGPMSGMNMGPNMGSGMSKGRAPADPMLGLANAVGLAPPPVMNSGQDMDLRFSGDSDMRSMPGPSGGPLYGAANPIDMDDRMLMPRMGDLDERMPSQRDPRAFVGRYDDDGRRPDNGQFDDRRDPRGQKRNFDDGPGRDFERRDFDDHPDYRNDDDLRDPRRNRDPRHFQGDPRDGDPRQQNPWRPMGPPMNENDQRRFGGENDDGWGRPPRPHDDDDLGDDGGRRRGGGGGRGRGRGMVRGPMGVGGGRGGRGRGGTRARGGRGR